MSSASPVRNTAAPAQGVAPETKPPSQESQDAARRAGRGGLAITAAKLWFVLAGFVQQTILPRIIGMEGYGAYSVAQAVANIPNNVVTAASIQGVSRAVAAAPPGREVAAQRGALRIHAVIAPCIALLFLALAPEIARFEHAPHIVRPLRVFAWTLLVYGLYTPLVGALNGRRRFVAQAGLDVTFATLRTIGLLAGAWLIGRMLDGVTGAALGIAVAATAILPVAYAVLGLRREKAAGSGQGALPADADAAPAAAASDSAPASTSALEVAPRWERHLRVLWPIALGQLALNLLMQADIWLLARFAQEAAVRAGLPEASLRAQTDTLVGAYRASQLFAFLPAQLLMSITFVLFPMVARAHAENDRAAVARFVRTGFRLAVVLAAAMVACVAGIGPHLLRFAFPPEAAERAGDALRILAVGQGAFALFSLQTTVLVSLGRERTSAMLTMGAAAAVALFCAVLVPSQPFGASILKMTATATTAALLASTSTGAVLVWRAAGGFLPAATLARTLLALVCAVVVGLQLPWLGRLWVLPEAAVVVLVYGLVAVGTRELTRADLSLIQRVVGRKARSSA